MRRGGGTAARSLATTLAVALVLGSPLLASAAVGDVDEVRTHPENFVKDSAITASVKMRLAQQPETRGGTIRVDTDAQGVVWLSGNAPSPEAAALAESIARGTAGVRDVQNHITVRSHD
jgi:hyperosmotically inducible protein